jgi:Spy/CpxP family protein refolding chaperone
MEAHTMRTHLLTNTLAALALFATASVPVAAAQAPEDDYGPGMMGSGMMGPGMMGGYYGMPHGMGMMGSGMMGPGTGMMGMGPGMGMQGAFYALDLNDDQRKKLTQIQDGLRKQHWELMGKVQDEYAKLRDLYAADTRDPAAIGAQAQRIFDLRRQMLESSVEAGNRMEALLTAEQKAQLRKDVRGGCPMW